MSLATTRLSIETKFLADWAVAQPTIPVAVENMPFSPPEEAHWIRLSIQPLNNLHNGLNECRELIGMVAVQVYSPVRQGTATQDELVDSAQAILTGAHNDIAYEDADIAPLGEVEGWYQCNIFVGFTTKG